MNMIENTHFRILIIDDNPDIHRDFIKILKTDKSSELDKINTALFGKKQEDVTLPAFEIDVASQGQEGLKRIEEAIQQGRPYSLAFVDIRMPPGWDGIETIKHIWAVDKNIQIVICTAYSDYTWEETVAHLGKSDNLLILKKPFDSVSVRQLACALTSKWQLTENSRRYTEMLSQQVLDRTLSLQQSLSLVKSTFESSSDGILVVNTEGNIMDYNQKLSDMLELPPSLMIEKSEKKVFDYLKSQLEKSSDFFEKMQKLHSTPEEISIDVVTLKNGKIFECYSQPHKLNGKTIGRILDFRDITKRAKLEKELEYQAKHDSLTGLANRVMLMDCMRIALKNAKDKRTKFALLFLDLDRFKLINDSLSHNAGDELLKITAIRLQEMLPAGDTLARLGGDEFVVIINSVRNEQDIVSQVNQLLKVFQKPFVISERYLTVTASIGISLYPDNGTTVDTLLQNADAAMYRAKAQKGNNFQFYSQEIGMQSLAELDQEMELRRATARGEFFLCYQPQFDLNGEKLVAVEALIRWQHPEKGVLLPVDFIPFAEETGLIIPISEWVLRTACAQNKAWQDAGFPPIRVAVNVTAQQFKLQNVTQLISDVLKETGLKPQYLELEMTENVILSNRETIRVLGELKELGVTISIDDFGTGYSSLSYLRKIPLDRLKIDSSFVQHIRSATDDEVIIRAIIAMAKNLNLEVLAEGVETEDQANFLKQYQCENVQGYYFSKPLLKEDMDNYFKNPSKNKILNHSDK
ncbi:diguanylate cyclase [Gammaproteobacteria bacterium SCGC AG-212-F23]|nr:diguanylate cyclase [Gammaproteobacteria bacterium SCGC AG-212-F23]